MTIKTDAVIIGAGPCGLFQVFELGLHGIHAHVVDSMRAVGGQCIELYPDKPIYDIPAVPVCSAAELIERLMEQIKPFDPTFHLDQEVTEVIGDGSGPFTVKTAAGTVFEARTVFVAGGVGSFQPRRLRVEGADELEDRHLFYRVRDPARFEGKDIVICGAGDSALDWVLELAPKAKSVVQIHRTDQYRAAPASVARMKELVAEGRMDLIEFGLVKELEVEDGALRAIDVEIDKKERRRIELDDLLVFFGLAPKLGPIANWGLGITRRAVEVDTEKFQTNIPGIFAIGDINTYPGKKKLILSGFHEAALAAIAAKAHIEPGKKVHLQYTTTSPLLHKRLGVADDA